MNLNPCNEVEVPDARSHYWHVLHISDHKILEADAHLVTILTHRVTSYINNGTEEVGVAVKTTDIYKRDVPFKSRPGHMLSWHRYFHGVAQSLRENSGIDFD
jgi:acetylornithine/succinyldiaminopimelate/putrescine aminotransferase